MARRRAGPENASSAICPTGPLDSVVIPAVSVVVQLKWFALFANHQSAQRISTIASSLRSSMMTSKFMFAFSTELTAGPSVAVSEDGPVNVTSVVPRDTVVTLMVVATVLLFSAQHSR